MTLGRSRAVGKGPKSQDVAVLASGHRTSASAEGEPVDRDWR